MLSSGNSRHLSARWARDRRRALWDRSGFSAQELEHLEVGNSEGYEGEFDRTMKAPLHPVDKNTTATGSNDMRKRPECGD